MEEDRENIDHQDSEVILARKLLLLNWFSAYHTSNTNAAQQNYCPPDYPQTRTSRRRNFDNNMATMRAIVIEQFGEPETLVYRDVQKPTPASGEALIQVKAFGINHAEMHM